MKKQHKNALATRLASLASALLLIISGIFLPAFQTYAEDADTKGNISEIGENAIASGASVFDYIDSSDRTVIKNPDSSQLSSVLDVFKGSMDSMSGWSIYSYGGKRSLDVVKDLQYSPYSVFEGDSAICAVCDEYREATSLNVSYAVNNTIDLSDAKYFALALWIADISGDPSLSYTVTLTLTASGNSYSDTKEISSGDWYALFFDISECRGLKDVHYISIEVKRFGSSDDSLVLAVGSMGASGSSDALLAMHYLSGNFASSENTEIKKSPSALRLEVDGENPYIETETASQFDMSNGRSVRIRFGGTNATGGNISVVSATLYYTTITSPNFSDDLSVTAEITSDGLINTCVFPIPEDIITGFRIKWGGTYNASIGIISVDTVIQYQTRQTGSISECAVSADMQSISVKGSIYQQYAALYKSSRLYLYTLEPYESAGDISIGSVAAAETDLNGTDFAFSLPSAGNNELLFKKYLVMIYFQGSLIQVASPVYITNPELLSENSRTLEEITGIKGSSVYQGDMPVSGEKYTSVQIRLEKLVSLSPSQTSYVYGGRSFYFNRDYIEYLDEICKECQSSKKQAFFVLTVSKSELEALNKFLLHPDSSSENALPFEEPEYYALNTETPDGILYLRAVCDFLASRYAAGGLYPCVKGFVLGSDIGNSLESYYMGYTNLSSFAESVSSAVHIIHNTVSLRSPETEIYVSLGCNWNNDISVNEKLFFDSRSLLDAISSSISASGDIDWHLAYDPYPAESGYTAWENINSTDVRSNTFESEKITFANLELLISYMSHPRLRYQGETRDIIILEKPAKEAADKEIGTGEAPITPEAQPNTENTPATNQETAEDTEKLKLVSSDYIYAYCKLVGSGFSGISAFIVSHDVSYIDTYSLIDTNLFPEISKYALNLMGISDFSEIISGFVQSDVQRRNVSEASISNDKPQGISGTAPLFGFSEGSDGFMPGSYCLSVTPGGSPSGKSGVLGVQFGKADAGQYMSIINNPEFTLDLSEMPYLRFEAQLTSLPSDVTEVKLTAVILSGEDSFCASGYISSGVWNTVYIDLAGFNGIGSCDSIILMISSDRDLGEPTLLLDTVYAMSSTHSDLELASKISSMKNAQTQSGRRTIDPATVKLLCLLILSAITLEVINILLRHRGKDQN